MTTEEKKKVKIVATLGPASESKEMILALARGGVNVFRLNLSHAKEEEIVRRVKHVRNAERVLNRPLTIMGDLAGPKIRIGNVEPGTQLLVGETVAIVKTAVLGTARRFSLSIPSILDNAEIGAEIYLGDGSPKLEVVKRIKDGIMARVLVGGELIPYIGFSIEGLVRSRFALSTKDINDIKTMLRVGADALAVSFVQTARDVEAVKALLPRKNPPLVIAKIETREGVLNAESIIDAADGLMIARGDLGFAVPIAELPHIQKLLITLALKKAKPVITATQMLESMIASPFPTRAEVTDVANAILDGTDAVMLSGETAKGKFPEEVIKTMVRVIREATPRTPPREFLDENTTPDAVSASVVNIANQVKARLIIVYSETGATARRIARHRPSQAIIALTPNHKTLHAMNFVWGVEPHKGTDIKSMDALVNETRKIAQSLTSIKLKKGEPFVISMGIPFRKSGGTNLILVNTV